MANDSFETPGAGSGFADRWDIDQVSDEVEIFGFHGQSNFSPSENFERFWKLPELLSVRGNEKALFAYILFNANGVGDSLDTPVAGHQTIVDAGASFTASMVGHNITLIDTNNSENSGLFEIVEFVSSTSVKFRNPNGLPETSNFKWVVSTAQLGAALFSGDAEETFEAAWDLGGVVGTTQTEQATQVLTDGVLWPVGHAGFPFELPLFGTGNTLGLVFNDEQRLVDVQANFPEDIVGRTITINGAQNAGNNVVTEITQRISSNEIVIDNPEGAFEESSFSWSVAVSDSGAFDSSALDILTLFNGDTDDSFENGWLLPGTTAGKTNDSWQSLYFDGTEYRFLSTHLSVFAFAVSGDVDSFETNWKNNQNSKLSFESSDLNQFLFNTVNTTEEFNDADWVLDLEASTAVE